MRPKSEDLHRKMVHKSLKISPVTEKNIFETEVKPITLILVVKKWSITNFAIYFRYKVHVTYHNDHE